MTLVAPANTIYQYRKLMWLILFCAAGLLFIWPLPGTIALRHVILGIGFIASLCYLHQQRLSFLERTAWPTWLFLGFYGWLIIHLVFFSHEWSLQIAELSSVWMRVALATPLGLALGLALTQEQYKSGTIAHQKSLFEKYSMLIIFIGLLGTFLIFFVRYVYQVHMTGLWVHFPFYEIPYKAKPPFVIGSALLLPLCFIMIKRSLNSSANKYWIFLALFGVAAVLFGDYFANTKNGIFIFGVCTILFLVNHVFTLQWNLKRFFGSLSIIVSISLLGAYGISKHLEQNTAWLQLISDINSAKDIEHQQWWKDSSKCCVPLNSMGTPVNISTYQRAAWFVAGTNLLTENPLGYGLVHHSFGSLALQKWPDFQKPIGNMRGATHSAWLDFALGLGIPGLLLVLIPLWVSWYRSLFQDGLWYSYASWTIPIMSFAYLTTEANEKHFIELLFFMTAFFCGLTLCVPVSKKPTQT